MPSNPEIVSNNQPRNMLYGYELTATERAEFDWISDEDLPSTDFVRYKGRVYCISEFVRSPDWLNEMGWHGCSPDSAFSATLISLHDSDQVVMGVVLS